MATLEASSSDTTAFVALIEASHTMLHAGLPEKFVSDAFRLAHESEGVFDLMMMWTSAEDDEGLRVEIVADVQDLIDDAGTPVGIRLYEPGGAIRIDDLEEIGKDAVRFKSHLRRLVDKAGGVTWLAGVTGIPQSSLSRFFSSGAIPRKSTLLKISDALGTDSVPIPDFGKF